MLIVRLNKTGIERLSFQNQANDVLRKTRVKF